ncbi:hypothetical protein [Rheinheimera soli]|uniref:hypothetical protein n=1 Tax=Rheinheimera soli TaxID=443616 RepID=UPI001E58644B|nr:hypothetical protein [Rheinheimera soli]
MQITKKTLLINTFTLAATFMSLSAAAAPSPAQLQFFDQLKSLCGKAFAGKTTLDNQPSAAFSGDMVMHVRDCSDTQIQVPFVVGENRSRTWIITKTADGLQLQHQHKHEDGSDDISTMYGGHTATPGWTEAQSFPADDYSKNLFIKTKMPQSIGNTWHMYLYPNESFSYRLTREGREFRVDFDLTKAVALPKANWGAAK